MRYVGRAHCHRKPVEELPSAPGAELTAAEGLHRAAKTANLRFHAMEEPDFAAVVAVICKEDQRFDRKAYDFVRLGLDQTVKELKKQETDRAGKSRHVSGPELLEGLRAFALDQYGPLAKTVLNAWGVTRCAHFGDIVFNLIEYQVFSKTDSDRREDFADLYDFDTAFVRPYEPANPRRVAGRAPEAA